MASIQVDIPNAADVARALDAFAGTFGYQTTISSGGSQIANPETKAQFAKRQLALWVKSIVVNWEQQQAGETARVTAKASADVLVIT